MVGEEHARRRSNCFSRILLPQALAVLILGKDITWTSARRPASIYRTIYEIEDMNSTGLQPSTTRVTHSAPAEWGPKSNQLELQATMPSSQTVLNVLRAKE